MKAITSITLILVLIFLVSCTNATTESPNGEPPHTPRPMPQIHPLQQNEDGNYIIIEPLNLLMGMTEEQWIENSLAYPRFNEIMYSIELHIGGGVSTVVNSNMIATRKQTFYNGGLLHIRYYIDAIKEVVYENELLSEITIFVDVELFQSEQYWNEREAVFFFLPNWVGTFQILSGVAPDEWHTTITVRCYDTNAFVSRTEFPHDNMFLRDW